MKNTCFVNVSVLVVTLASVLRFSTQTIAAVSANTEPSAWTNTYKYGSGVVSNVVGMKACVGVHFPGSDPAKIPPEGVVCLVTGGSPANSPFAGNYLASGMESIAFKLNTTTNTMSVSVVLVSVGGTQWNHPVDVPSAAGTWATLVVPIALDGGWYMSEPGDADGSQWTQDLASVSYVGLAIGREGFSSQVATIDSFILAGTGFVTPPAVLLALGDALEARFGVRNFSDLTAAQKAQDADKDGMTDVNEILAGTDPDNKNSVFAATVAAIGPEGVTIQWPSVSGGVYTVSRCGDLVAGDFQALTAGYRLTATQDGTMSFTDKTAKTDGGPYFYRIVKE